MNRERMLKLATAIETRSLPVGFDMSSFCSVRRTYVGSEEPIACGTTCCIAGWASLLFGERGDMVGEVSGQLALGLDVGEVMKLFYNYDDFIKPDCQLEDITVTEAVASIRRMVQEDVDKTPVTGVH